MHWIIRMRTGSILRYWFRKRSISLERKRICTNLTVDFTAVCYRAILFHILGNVAFMDGCLFGVIAVAFFVNFVIMFRIPHFRNFIAGKQDDSVLPN